MHRSFYDSICPYQPKNVEGCSKPVDHLLVNPNSGEKSQWTRCVKKWAANWIYFRMFLFDLCGRIGNDGENMDFLFGFWLCMQGTWQMFSWRWLQFIPLWRPMGNLACDFSEFWWWGCPIKTVFFAGAPPKETICFVIQSSSGCRRDFNSDEPVETIRVAYLQFRKGYNCALAFRSWFLWLSDLGYIYI